MYTSLEIPYFQTVKNCVSYEKMFVKGEIYFNEDKEWLISYTWLPNENFYVPVKRYGFRFNLIMSFYVSHLMNEKRGRGQRHRNDYLHCNLMK